MHQAFEAGVLLLDHRAQPNLLWEAEIVENADHGDNPIRSTPMAIRGFGEFATQLSAETTGRAPPNGNQ